MKKKSSSRWWKYLTSILIGILLFASLFFSYTTIFSSQLSVLGQENQSNHSSIITDIKSLEEIIINLPTATEIRAMPLSPHPRLLASNERFAEIRQQVKTDKTMKKWYKKLEKDAQRYLSDKPVFYRLQDKIRMVDTSRLVLKRVITLALVYRLNPDKRYLDRVWQELKAVSEFPDWNPSHFLDTAEMTQAVAIGYDWLYEFWNLEQRKIISSSILKQGLKPALKQYRYKTKWTTLENNWNQVCNGGIGVGSLAILDEYPVIASQAIYNSLKRLPKAMQHYAPDGAFDEGTSYWDYATKYNTLILDALHTSLGTDFDLSQIAGFAETGFFPIYMSGTSGAPFNFADSKERFLRSPQLFWMSDKFHKYIYKVHQKQMAAPEALDLVWYKPLRNSASFEQLPLDKYFRGSEIVSMRSEWNNSQAIFVGFKAGDNKVNHSNLDLGTFVLDALGVRWAVELGNDDYNLPGYFNEDGPRWKYYRMRAEGQNTLVINPDQNPDQNPDATTKINSFISKPKKASATVDLTPAYTPIVDRINRKITLDRKRNQVFLEDKIKAKAPVEAWWFMHTKADIKISRDQKTAILFQEGVRLKAKINNRNKYRFEIMKAEPLPTSPNPKGQRTTAHIRKLAIHLNNISTEKLKIVFIPEVT